MIKCRETNIVKEQSVIDRQGRKKDINFFKIVTVKGIFWVTTWCTLIVAYLADTQHRRNGVRFYIPSHINTFFFFQICLLKPQTWKQRFLRKHLLPSTRIQCVTIKNSKN